jgi:Xaa-Pro aminopeptidase
LADRLDTIVPRLMDAAEIDAWVLLAREYAEDPVLATMLPAAWLSTARRRTILVFTCRGRERAAIARYPVGDAFPQAWDPADQPDQWAALADHLIRSDPATIAVNTSSTFPLADGLTASEARALRRALPPEFDARLVDADPLAIGWLETRLPSERGTLEQACSIAHGYLRRALSAEVITPGRTTTDDVVWWLRQEVHEAGLDVWFQPSVSVQRAGGTQKSIAGRLLSDTSIEQGDLVHIDFGIVWRGLHTDQQQHAYVLQPGEAAPPGGLVAGLAGANRLQDILMEQMVPGRSGNEVLAATRAQAVAAGLQPTIYTHPIGLHGHAAGATIGLWDQQDGVPGQGDYPVRPSTAWSIELSVEVPVPEWDRPVRIMLEEDAFHDGNRVSFLDGRQSEFWLI